LRIVAGGFLLAHGWPKLMNGAPSLVGAPARLGLSPPLAWAWFMILLENLSGICIILGLFTRPIATMLVVYFTIITFAIHWSNGFAFSAPRGGWEFPAMWGLAFLVILLQGGDPFSLDRKLGQEI
jgi:putative oxidoreductase